MGRNSQKPKPKEKWRRQPRQCVDALDVLTAMEQVFDKQESFPSIEALAGKTVEKLINDGLVTAQTIETLIADGMITAPSLPKIDVPPGDPYENEFAEHMRSLMDYVFLPLFVGGYLVENADGIKRVKEKGRLTDAFIRNKYGVPQINIPTSWKKKTFDEDFDQIDDPALEADINYGLDPGSPGYEPPPATIFPRQSLEQVDQMLRWASRQLGSKEKAYEEFRAWVQGRTRKPQGRKPEEGQREYELFMNEGWSWRRITADAGFDRDNASDLRKVQQRAQRYAERNGKPLPNTRPRRK